MAIKLLFVIEEKQYEDPCSHDIIEQMQDHVRRWLKEEDNLALVLVMPIGTKLKVLQVGDEILKNPPEIEVQYKPYDELNTSIKRDPKEPFK